MAAASTSQSDLSGLRASKFGRAEKILRYWPKGVEVQQPPLLASPRTNSAASSVTSRDSGFAVRFPFATNVDLQSKYSNPSITNIRFGKVLEDLDMVAGMTGWTHAFYGADKPPAAGEVGLVTASVDRIHVSDSLSLEEDMSLSGRVSWVGRSSLEVHCTIHASARKVLDAYFVMVARNFATNEAYTMPRLTLETDEDRAIFAAGEARSERRQAERKTSLKVSPPSEEESRLLHRMYLKGSGSGGAQAGRLMSTTRHQSTSISHIQDQNTNKTIYGGTLMRKGFELAYIAASVYLRSPAEFLQLNQLHFLRPVPVGSILSLDSVVNYVDVERRLVYVRVLARCIEDVQNPQMQTLTNTFQFTFSAETTPEPVIPHTYDEMITYLEGYRENQAFAV